MNKKNMIYILRIKKTYIITINDIISCELYYDNIINFHTQLNNSDLYYFTNNGYVYTANNINNSFQDVCSYLYFNMDLKKDNYHHYLVKSLIATFMRNKNLNELIDE